MATNKINLWSKWDNLCLTKTEGGLGLHDPELVKKMLGDKIRWKWVNYST